jgi:hypothetical protein
MARGAFADYDGDFLECRRGNLGHAWRAVGFWREADGVVCRGLICPRCDTERIDRWDRTSGERIGATYKYPNGYYVEADSEGHRPDTFDVRREVIRRAKVYANEGAMLAAMTEGRVR